MTEHPDIPPDSPADRIREHLAGLPEGSPVGGALARIVGLAASAGGGQLGIVEGLAETVAEWVGSSGSNRYRERVVEILWHVVEELDRLRITKEEVRKREDWIELLLDVLPRGMRARTEEKRRCFALLLISGFHRKKPNDFDEGHAMAIILDQLDYVHVEALADLSVRPHSTALDMFWGNFAEGTFDLQDMPHNIQYGARLLRLEALGLITISDVATRSPGRQQKAVRINDAGVRFLRWVRGEPG